MVPRQAINASKRGGVFLGDPEVSGGLICLKTWLTSTFSMSVMFTKRTVWDSVSCPFCGETCKTLSDYGILTGSVLVVDRYVRRVFPTYFISILVIQLLTVQFTLLLTWCFRIHCEIKWSRQLFVLLTTLVTIYIEFVTSTIGIRPKLLTKLYVYTSGFFHIIGQF